MRLYQIWIASHFNVYGEPEPLYDSESLTVDAHNRRRPIDAEVKALNDGTDGGYEAVRWTFDRAGMVLTHDGRARAIDVTSATLTADGAWRLELAEAL